MAILASQTPKAFTAAGVSAPFSTAAITTLAVDVNVSAVSGSSTPTLTLFLERQGADGIWYAVWSPTAITAIGATSTSIGPGCPTNAVLTAQARLRWTVTGTTPSLTMSYSVEGR